MKLFVRALFSEMRNNSPPVTNSKTAETVKHNKKYINFTSILDILKIYRCFVTST